MDAAAKISPEAPLCSTGVEGLDDVLVGGLPRRRVYLVRGAPGTGKTTLALQFLLDGVRRGERCLYITLSETMEELTLVARSHGWSLDGVDLVDLSAIEHQLRPESQTTLLHPAEQELARTTQLVQARVDELKPERVVFDSLSEMRLMAQSPLRYRRQILAIKSFFSTRDCTVLLLDDESHDADTQVESLAHGVIELEHLRPDFGSERRRLSVIKLRGVKFRGGYHDYVINTGGLDVFPRLVAAEHAHPFPDGTTTTGIEALDTLLGGGIDRGTSTLIVGPAGVGKSSVALHCAVATAAAGGGPCAMFVFEETIGTLRLRAQGLGLELDHVLKSGALRLKQVDPAELSPGEFAVIVRRLVEEQQSKLVVIDSLNGYLNSMPGEQFQVAQLHELLTYLAQRGVITLMALAQQGFVGQMQSTVDLTYVADTVLMLRYFEFQGTIKKAISVVKRRSGHHEATIRELQFVPDEGVRIGPPLTAFRGVLSGIPVYTGAGDTILTEGGDGDA